MPRRRSVTTDTVTVEVESPVVEGNDFADWVIVTNPTWASGSGTKTRQLRRQGQQPRYRPVHGHRERRRRRGAGQRQPDRSVAFVSSKVAKPDKRVKFRYAWTHTGVWVGDDVECSGSRERRRGSGHEQRLRELHDHGRGEALAARASR